MKISLTPGLAYVIGLWRARKTSEGIGIEGNQRIRDIFLVQVLAQKIAEPDKIQLKEDKLFFYHSAYRAFFDDVVKNQLERFAYRNDYSASYLAGMMDGFAGIKDDKEGKMIFFPKASASDEMLLLRLGFRAKRSGGKLMVISGDELLAFVKGKLKFLAVQ